MAPVEGVFSPKWKAARNRFTVPTIKSLLIVKANFNLPCPEFMEKLAKENTYF